LKQTAANQRQTIADAEQRTAEALAKIAGVREFQLAELGHRQAREQELVREHVAEMKPTFYAEERPVEAQRAANGHSRGDDDAGRERVHYRHFPRRPPLL
jgi:hypothetical protein